MVASKKKFYILSAVVLAAVTLIVYLIQADPFQGAYTFNQSIDSSNSNDIVDRSIFNSPAQPAPDFQGISQWLNTPDGQALSLKDLRGQVVLIDFWTYSCINCIRTLPYITEWDRKYRDAGLVIVGVHSPEFQFEKSTANVLNAMQEYNIEYAVAQDNDFKTWRAYRNQFWPAKYFIDHKGNVVWQHFGEGKYEESEKVIQQLLKGAGLIESGLDTSRVEAESADFQQIGTPELYFGYLRLSPQNFGNPEPVLKDQSQTYGQPSVIEFNKFYLVGDWQIGPESAVLVSDRGKIIIKYRASQANIVMQASTPITAEVFLDGEYVNRSQAGSDVKVEAAGSTTTIQASQLYNFIDTGSEYSEHILELRLQSPGAEAFAFTFG